MVKAAPEQSIEQVSRADEVGKAHGGFVVALFLAAPALMVASMLLVGFLIGAAQGATGTLWLGATGMFGTMATIFGGALFLAESNG